MGRRLLVFGCLVGLIFGFSSCHHRNEHQDYAQRAYSEQEAERAEGLCPSSCDEESTEDLVLEIKPCLEKSEWQRRPYETVDSWLERLRHYLLANQDLIDDLHERDEQLDLKKKKHSDKMKSLIERNEELRAEINKPRDDDTDFVQATPAVAPPSPFSVYVVERGETLFSIAMKHYGSGAMVNEIMLWNQGWIRQPDELVAGVGLVLFPSDAPDTKKQVVDQYLDQVSANAIQTSIE